MMKAVDETSLPKRPNTKLVDELYYDLVSDRIEEFMEARRNAHSVSG
jgi:hypothetical protein